MTNQNQQNQIKQLRNQTGAGFSLIRAALAEAAGDIKNAKEILKKRGLEVAAKKESRAANAGIVEAYVHHGAAIGVLMELRCETDFVARNPSFKELAHDIAMHIAATNPRDIASLMSEPFIKDDSKTIGDMVAARAASFGERIEIGRFIRYVL